MHDAQTVIAPPLPVFFALRLRLHPAGHTVDVTRSDVILGRHSESDLRLPMPDVSRRHCRFVFAASGWEVVDLGSLNGVFVNGARVLRSPLRPGDQLRLGGLEFEVESPSEDEGVIRSIAEALPAEPERKAS